jgi:hypothetical protein
MVSVPTKIVGDYSFPVDPGFGVAHGGYFSK